MQNTETVIEPIAEGTLNRAPVPALENEALRRIRELFGPEAVCVPVRFGDKKPVFSEWQQKTIADMDDPDYLATFINCNVGVLCGEKSNGLVSIDVDSDEGLEELLRLNPSFADTALTKAERGGNVWLRLTDEAYPPLTKLYDPERKAWGELRSTGGQTVVCGMHPSGCEYEIANDSRPIEISFDEINWPENVENPWVEDPLDRLIEREGEPFQFGVRGSCAPNQNFFASAFALENLVIWCLEEQGFYAYDEGNGVWTSISHEKIRERVLRNVQRVAERQNAPLAKEVKSALKLHFLNGVVELLKGRVEKRNPFAANSRLLNAKNGTVFNGDLLGAVLLPHSYEHMLRNRHEFSFIKKKSAPYNSESGFPELLTFRTKPMGKASESLQRVREQLGWERGTPRDFLRFLQLNLTTSEIVLLQKVFGSILFGGNLCQKIVLILGKPGSGKSVVLDVMRLIVGAANTVQLRTEHLANRFETARFVGKKLLVGPDVEADFLRRKEANFLKSLVGHDFLSSEGKNNPNDVPLRGDMGVVVTSNHQLRINAGDDLNAWRRRLLVLRFDKPFIGKKIPNFAERLVGEEGDAIFTWAIKGGELLAKDIKAIGDFILSEDQKAKVQRIVDDSGSLRLFVETCLEKPGGGSFGGLSTTEIVDAYNGFCRHREFEVQPDAVTQKKLPDLMMEIHGLPKGKKVSGPDGRSGRGYHGVGLKDARDGS